MSYSSKGISSTMLMNKQSSSIKSSFVGVTNGERINDCNMSSTCDYELDALGLLGGLSTIIQSVGSVLVSSSSKSRFLISSSLNSESTKMTANFVLKSAM